MKPSYNLDKIKYATDQPTFKRAVAIYESGGVKNFEYNGVSGFLAKVRGSKGNFYNVFVSSRHYDEGNCDCYLGHNDTLCKHMVAVAIYVVMDGKKLSKDDKELVGSPVCSGKLGSLGEKELSDIKKIITSNMRYIKPYNGPSRTWFAYQNSLDEGCARLSKLVSDLPVCEQAAKLLVDMLLRLDKKLCVGGVDDSNGTVGGFMEETVLMLQEYAKLDPGCVKVFKKLRDQETCFDWEEPLVELVDK